MLETLVTNAEEETRGLRERLGSKGILGAVYGPLTSQARYLVIDDQDWNGLVNMQRVAPVSLTEPHGQAQILCVVGERVIWQGAPARSLIDLEPNLRKFASTVGLEIVELVLAPVSDSVCVIAVEPQPHFELFDVSAQGQIVDGIVRLLTKDATSGRC